MLALEKERENKLYRSVSHCISDAWAGDSGEKLAVFIVLLCLHDGNDHGSGSDRQKENSKIGILFFEYRNRNSIF